MAKKELPKTVPTGASDLFARRDELAGKTTGLEIETLDARLLWMVVCILAKRSASIQLGVTRDGGAWAVQYWDGKFPLKEYYGSTKELNWSLAGLIKADGGNTLSPDWQEICQEYGW